MEGKENMNDNRKATKFDIFTEEIPKCGKVSMLFYIPDKCKDKIELTELITEKGGNISLFHECFTYQVACPDEINNEDIEKQYYKGSIFSSDWIKDSIKEDKLLPRDKYALRKLGKGKDFEYAKGKMQYTIREVVMIYDWIKDKKLKNSKRTWQVMVDQGIIFCRSDESLKNFWKTNQKNTVEECIESLLKREAKYCHQYPNPIYPHDEAKINTNVVEEVKDPQVKRPNKVRKIQKSADKNEKNQLEPVNTNSDATKKKPVVRNFDDIASDEDITPLVEEHQYEVQVISQLEGDSEESGSEIDLNELEEVKQETQLEDQLDNQQEDQQNDSNEKAKKKSEASVSTLTKMEDMKTPSKEMEIKCSQNSLSNFLDGYGVNSNTSEKPLKEKKNLLVSLLNDDSEQKSDSVHSKKMSLNNEDFKLTKSEDAPKMATPKKEEASSTNISTYIDIK